VWHFIKYSLFFILVVAVCTGVITRSSNLIMITHYPRRYFIVLILALPLNPLWAGDEAMFTPYTQIDPETGFSITIEQPAMEHAIQNTDESVVLNEPVANTPVIKDSLVSDGAANQILSILAGIVILAGGLSFWYRKTRQV